MATVNALLAYGADVNVVDVDGTTPLHGVAGISRTDREKITRAHDSFVAEFAVDKAPSNPNEDFDAVKTAEALIAAGANVNAKGRLRICKGRTGRARAEQGEKGPNRPC